MHNDKRTELLHCLQQTCCDTARGTFDQAGRNMSRAAKLLDQLAGTPGAPASLQVVRSYMAEADTALLHSDSLGMVLPLLAILELLRAEPRNPAGHGDRESTTADTCPAIHLVARR